jgi:hypothetical protein
MTMQAPRPWWDDERIAAAIVLAFLLVAVLVEAVT